MTNAPWYVRNNHLHRDFKIKTIDVTIKERKIQTVITDYDENMRLRHKRPRSILF